MRRSIGDIGVSHLHGTQGRIQGRTLGVSGGTCSCGGSFRRAHVHFLLPCLRSRAPSKVEPRLDGAIRVRVWVSLKPIPQVSRIWVMAVFPVDGRAICGRVRRTFSSVVRKSDYIHH